MWADAPLEQVPILPRSSSRSISWEGRGGGRSQTRLIPGTENWGPDQWTHSPHRHCQWQRQFHRTWLSVLPFVTLGDLFWRGRYEPSLPRDDRSPPPCPLHRNEPEGGREGGREGGGREGGREEGGREGGGREGGRREGGREGDIHRWSSMQV